MAETFKFPKGGYDVTVVKKADVIECIENNILDKDVALAIVERCELDCIDYVKNGRWAGVPYMGNFRIPKTANIMQDDATTAMINEAKEALSHDKFVLFRKQIAAEIGRNIKMQRYYNYIVSMGITKNKKYYKSLVNQRGIHYAKLKIFGLNNITYVNNEYVLIDEYEQ